MSTGELSRSLARIEAIVDKVAADHESRLRRIERVAYVALGVVSAHAVASALISAIGG